VARRVYTGKEPVSFVTGGIGHVEPGDPIEVPAALCEGFDRRADIAVLASEHEAEAAAAGAEAKAGRRRPGGKQSGGSPAAEAQ